MSEASHHGTIAQLLAEQVAQHGRFYFKIAYEVVRDAAEAEDAVQQAFMKAWEHQDRLRSPGALRSWLAQTVIRECLTHHRRRKTTTRVLQQQAQMLPTESGEATERHERRERILAGVAELPEPIRAVVSMRLLNGLTGEQVKEIMNCSAAEVSRRLHEGMEILRRKLKVLQDANR